jgi:hypothetical protein
MRIAGCPITGKTTIVEKLRARDIVAFDSDVFRRRLIKDAIRRDLIPYSQEREAMRAWRPNHPLHKAWKVIDDELQLFIKMVGHRADAVVLDHDYINAPIVVIPTYEELESMLISVRRKGKGRIDKDFLSRYEAAIHCWRALFSSRVKPDEWFANYKGEPAKKLIMHCVTYKPIEPKLYATQSEIIQLCTRLKKRDKLVILKEISSAHAKLTAFNPEIKKEEI